MNISAPVNSNVSGISGVPTRRGLDKAGNLVFLPYDPKAPISEKGLRTSKVMYKTAKTGENAGIKKGNNVCMLVEPLESADVTANIDRLIPHIIGMLELEQDKIIKAAHIAGGDDSTLEVSAIDIEHILAVLEAERVSGRMTKEVITDWFDSELADTLTVLFADKLGISEEPTQQEADKIDAFIGVYRAKFAGLSSGVVSYSVDESTKLLAALEKCGIDFVADIIAARIREKLNKMINPVEVHELIDL